MSKKSHLAGAVKIVVQTRPEQVVRVLSPSGYYLYDVPETEAKDLLRHRLADRAGNDSIRLHEFQLPKWMRGRSYVRLATIQPQKRWPKQWRERWDDGKCTKVYPEYSNDRPSRVYELLPIPSSARDLYITVLTSCLVKS
jgi:hypothetical protein